jgi:hypothetical protein
LIFITKACVNTKIKRSLVLLFKFLLLQGWEYYEARFSSADRVFGSTFFFIAEIYFRIFFLNNKFISENYLLTIKTFRKAANKLGDLNMIH